MAEQEKLDLELNAAEKRITEEVRMRSWLYRLRKWWRNRKMVGIKGSDLVQVVEQTIK